MTGPMIFNVLSDGESFGSADGSFILIGPSAETITEEAADELENGRLPDEWFDSTSVSERPSITIALTPSGDLVALYSGFGKQRDNTIIVLADADTLGRLA